jgi:eukaryotic-like serine/threonine-protein kinase
MGQPSDTPAPSSKRDVVEVWLSYAPGERIAGKYQLIRMLDQGGMGVIWVAHHLGLDVHVALKLVRPEVASPEAAERLVVEAQAAARVRHPAIINVLDVGRTAEGDPFLVMELLDGEALGEILDRERRLDVVTALRIILPITGALEAMHAKGIIHRDVKPDNIFLARDDAGRWQPKLIDFGLARLDEKGRSARITQRGALIGTPVYLSPERLRGEDADPRDDVWALCVVLYGMVTGELPFEGETFRDLFMALVDGVPRSLASHGVNDPALQELLRRGLSPGGKRWTMGELGMALTRELLSRGATKDIAGLALRSTALGAHASQIVTTRIVRAAAVRSLADSPPPRREPPPDEPPLGARLTPVIALALVMLGVVLGLIAGVLLGRSTVAGPRRTLPAPSTGR